MNLIQRSDSSDTKTSKNGLPNAYFQTACWQFGHPVMAGNGPQGKQKMLTLGHIWV